MSAAALADVGRMAALLAARPDVDPALICVRGSSMGGFFAIHAAASSASIAGALAICPASEEGLRRGLRQGRFEMRVDTDSMDAWLAEHEIADAVARVAPKPLLLMHAQGDEQVPVSHSEDLFRAAGDPKRLIVVPGGNHRSAQHDPELQATGLRWLGRQLRGR
jgi:fermentation-respiration switch protein FrsA (DUF1100 family)